MRLTKIKLAGFKSFVDPTLVSFPSNLTGIVGPNGCGKSNVIDAVRWVMGELSARHLRGDSMADVVFNGSSARKPVGTASVELIFDNADGKIGGPYAGYNEVSLRRQVARDGTSNYFINGVRCRRKDITQLFLGTGLGSRSYAIIEQGMISRIIESKPEDMRCFVEEAAGISRYKERRRETESRIGETRENLERLQDVRDEIDKQIRHLQRQAATARRYRALKERERLLTAQLLALRCASLTAVRTCTTARCARASLPCRRACRAACGRGGAREAARLSCRAERMRLGGAGALLRGRRANLAHRAEHPAHARAARAAARGSGAGARHAERACAAHGARRARAWRAARRTRRACTEAHSGDERRRGTRRTARRRRARPAAVAGALGGVQPLFGRRPSDDAGRARAHRAAGEPGAAPRNPCRPARGRARRPRQQDQDAQLAGLAEQEALARSSGEQLAQALSSALERTQTLRAEQLAVEARLEAARAEREQLRAELVSLEALQQAAFNHGADGVGEWLGAAGLAGRPRAAAALEVAAGWERAVETALGDYLEAVCVERLDEVGARSRDLPPAVWR
jgi:chromosome segregation protein